jgi:hypothetical protein
MQREHLTGSPNSQTRHRVGRAEPSLSRTRNLAVPKTPTCHIGSFLRHEELLYLQRAAGNQAVIDLLGNARGEAQTRGLTPADVPRHPLLTVQAKRTHRLPADTKKLKQFGPGVGISLKADLSDEERLNAIWSELNKRYASSAEKGARLWGQLTDQQRRLREDPGVLSASLQKVRADYERRYRDHYITAVRSISPGFYEGRTEGFVSTKPEHPDPNVYLSKLNISERVIDVARAYANKDKARIEDQIEAEKGHGVPRIGLPASEVLWQQFLAAAREYFWYQKESRAKDLLGKIAGMRVSQAVNDPTLHVVFMAYPNGEFWETHDRIWRPGQEEFNAILGTPLLGPAIYMLLDHLDEVGGRLIESITTTGGNDRFIDIRFAEPPVSYDVAIALGMALIVTAVFGAWYLRS